MHENLLLLPEQRWHFYEQLNYMHVGLIKIKKKLMKAWVFFKSV